jgi:hypothetical protein
MSSAREFLVSYGRAGEFGRFCPADGLDLSRGDRVVVRSPQGVELGTVLCPATDGHGRFLSRTALGEILRSANTADEQAGEASRQRGQRLFDDGRQLARELGLPLEIVDAEVLLDGQQATLYYVAGQACDYRPLVSQLSRRHDVLLVMQNLSLPKEAVDAGCGRPDCGKKDGPGGCATCGSGGCGTCSAGTRKEDIAAQLAMLRARMEERAGRQPLL